MKTLLEQLLLGYNLTSVQMQQVIGQCMQGELNEIQMSAFLALMRMKGESTEELTAAAQSILKYTHFINLGDNLIDIVGTGGDGKNTFNISTVSSFVTAAAGVRVAKHGNHSASSRSGSADVLAHAGFELNLSEKTLQQCMQECGIAFLYAPHYHQALRHVKNVRNQLGIRTLFNLLGPLLNPAQVKKQVVGVCTPNWLKPIAEVLVNLGSEHALVVNSKDGLDEISIAATTHVIEYRQGRLKEWEINPKDYGCYHPHLDTVIINSPSQSLALAMQVFSGEQGPARDIILLNTAAALYCADACTDFAAGIEKAAHAIDSGAAYNCFINLQSLTKAENNE